ncbi:MAG: molybdopterin converting factor subunit 1 [Planctomycetes bacterium]|nr:molybdopterin converting factor subunit 1 [Planctomycetota bacterium]
MIEINVLFLGPARDFAGVDSATIELPNDAIVGELRTILADRHPGLVGAMATIRFAVNQEFADDETVLKSGDEVALIPPVSGGTDSGLLIDLVRDAIDPDRIRDFVTGDATLGGITTFEGVTRGETDPEHGELSHLVYEAYEAMAREKLDGLAREAKERWSAERVAIVHRLGTVRPGEASVVIAVACAHRAQCFEACRWLIDTLKKEVPIWKKDVYQDGFTRWVDKEP